MVRPEIIMFLRFVQWSFRLIEVSKMSRVNEIGPRNLVRHVSHTRTFKIGHQSSSIVMMNSVMVD